MKRTGRIWRLLAGLVVGCGAFFVGCKETVSYDKYTNADLYQIGNAAFTAAQVKKVEIDWIAGEVEIEQSASDVLQITEESPSAEETERMHYFLDGDVLRIKYCQSGYRGSINERNKSLFVAIPNGVSLEVESISAGITVGVIESPKVALESVSGNIMAERIVCEKGAEMETVSGKISLGDLTAPTLSLESTSGTISVVKLSVDSLEAETVSGELAFGVEKAVEADVESMSGAVRFYLAENLGATIYWETATGKFQSDRPYEKNGARYDVYGEQGAELCRLEIDTFSGNLTVQ